MAVHVFLVRAGIAMLEFEGLLLCMLSGKPFHMLSLVTHSLELTPSPDIVLTALVSLGKIFPV